MPSRTTRIVRVAALWRNDAREGLNIGLHFEAVAGDRFASCVRRAMSLYDSSATPERCVAWLLDVARHKDTLGAEELQRAVATIHWLERRGHLLSDEFNGVLWMARRGRALVVLRESVPTVPREHHVRPLPTADFEREVRAIWCSPRSADEA